MTSTVGSDRRDTSSGSVLATLLVVMAAALFLGGGGSRFALMNLAVQLVALTALSFHREAFGRFWRGAPLAMRIVAIASLLLPLAQIVPLPPGLWSALPGRDLVVRSFGLAAPGDDSLPPASFSVDAVRTLLALTALIVPVAVLAIGWIVRRDRLILAGWAVIAIAIAHFGLGIVQVLSNGESGLLYPQNPMPGVLFGFFANRNSTGLFLVGALILATLLPPVPGMGRSATLIRVAAMVLLVLGIALTRSRTAVVLAGLPLALGVLRYLVGSTRAKTGPARRNQWIALGIAAAVAAVVAGLLVLAPGRVGDTLERFESGGSDPRTYIWDDARYTVDRYWPAGSGMGTFDEVFQVDESLENMAQLRAGRAHGDYIEIAIEAGAAGLVLVAAWVLVLVWLAWRARHSHGRWIAWSGGAILATIALQSITDYPLRNLSMLGFAAFALLLLVRFGDGEPPREDRA